MLARSSEDRDKGMAATSLGGRIFKAGKPLGFDVRVERDATC